MFNYIKGKIINKSENAVVLENNGIGYDIFISGFTNKNLSAGQEVMLFTYFQVSENGIALYGFCDGAEKSMFLKLIGVNGVGPKAANNILSNIDAVTLNGAILGGDINLLSSVKGIGRKTAEKIFIELKDKLEPIAGGGTYAVTNDVTTAATDALMSLGLKKVEAERLARQNYEEGIEVNDIVARCLRGL